MTKSIFTIIRGAVCLTGIAMLISCPPATAQSYLNGPVTSSLSAGEYYNANGIVFGPGFSANGSTGNYHFYILAGCTPLNNSFSQNQNYILTSTPRIPSYNPASTGYTTCDVSQAIQYFDGLGRPIQSIQVNGSPTGRDIVQPVTYDQYGREANKYLPYSATPATSDGSYKSTAITDQGSFYNSPAGTTWNAPGVVQISTSGGVTPSFAQTGYEPSPLNRVVEQGATGAAWQLSVSGITGSGHTSKMVYSANNITALTDTANSTVVALYTVTINSDGSRTLNQASGAAGNYAAGELYVTISKDENWTSGRGGTMEEYKDKEGHTVLKRTFNWTGSVLQILSTYYVYDDLGNLAFVLPPLSGADTAIPNQTTLDNYCYQYRYDERNRLTQKKLPGKGWEYIVYNQLDQPVLTQDAIQRTSNQWTVTKYDALGRVVVTGLWNAGSAIPLATLQASIYGAAQWDIRDAANNVTLNPTGYVISSYPVLSTPLTINYYDDYTAPGQPSTITTPAGASTMTRGLLTATKTAVLNTPADMLWAVNYYDDQGRNTQTYKQHYLGGVLSTYNYDIVTNSYDFTNELTGSTRKHYTKNAGNTAAVLGVTIANTYVYDHVGRKTQTWEQINSGTNVLLSQTDYNEIGQVMTKHLHSTNSGGSFLQNTSFAYNERGWLSKINDPAVASLSGTQLFAEQLYYNTASPNGSSPQYNGNIAEEDYANYTPSPAATTKQHTLYAYDNVNRLLSGTSSAGNSENGIGYDFNGNITALTRTGASPAVLVYKYTDAVNNPTGNQLQSVTKGGAAFKAYTYDSNGNVGNDGINAITYNLLNLPQTVTVSSPAASITYTYDAAGDKLRKVSSTSGTTDYISGIQYKTNSTVIDFIQTEEGRAINTGSSWNYEYTLTDHLGNNRVTFDQTNGKTSEDDYYPFGLNAPKLVNGNLYLYNKKELQQETNLYDYGARFYDPVIARWTTVDPLAEKYRRWSPYNYGADDPIRFVDPDGMGLGDFLSDAWNAAKKNFTGYYSSIANTVKSIPAKVNSLKTMSAGDLAKTYAKTYVKALPINIVINNAKDVVQGVKGLVTGNGTQFGGAVGRQVANTTTALVTDGLASGAGKAISAVKGDITVFRAFGGDANMGGYSWTPENPNSVANFRDAAGLPSGGESGSNNTGEFLIKGTVNKSNIITQRAALPLDGNTGGLSEYIINPANVNVSSIKAATPNF
jgi:RHS repeat-associated protein